MNKMGKDAELCQIAAMNQTGDLSFAEYILPNKNIERHALKVNNLTIRTINDQRALFKESNQVQTLTSDEALTYLSASLKHRRKKSRNQHQRMSVCSGRS